MDLWHVSEEQLPTGAIIRPGRWGSAVLAQGKNHPFFYRELLLELWRIQQSEAPVSRLACCFAFESREDATGWAEQGDHVHQVRLAQPNAPALRLDMLWISWLGEAASPEATWRRLSAYWSGGSSGALAAHARPTWEWLVSGSLLVV